MNEFKSLMPYAKALELLRSYSKEFPSEIIGVESIDRVVSEDIFSDIDSPAFDRSAMDGYAIQAKDTFTISEGSYVTLKVIDSIAAGTISEMEVSVGRQ